jgi:fructosamine-3-kinase
MSLSPRLLKRIAAAAGAAVTEAAPLRGGDIAKVWRITLADGRVLAAKAGRNLALEGWMLDYLRTRTNVPVPHIHHAEDDLLLIDFIANDGKLEGQAEAHLADVVAELHAIEGPHFGFERATPIGGLPQANDPADDWGDFFRDRRLLAMARVCTDAGRLPAALMARIERLGGRLRTWIAPGRKPALIHGDLWGGNILSRAGKIVGLIDPALYFADPEIELAFMTLFGSVGDRFFARYAERRSLHAGFFEERRDLYNLYPLLVHVRLFGSAYVPQVEKILIRYGC